MYNLIEAGWDAYNIPFSYVDRFKTLDEARDAFRDRLMHELGYDKDNENSVDNFESIYSGFVEGGQFDDVSRRYMIAIVENQEGD